MEKYVVVDRLHSEYNVVNVCNTLEEAKEKMINFANATMGKATYLRELVEDYNFCDTLETLKTALNDMKNQLVKIFVINEEIDFTKENVNYILNNTEWYNNKNYKTIRYNTIVKEENENLDKVRNYILKKYDVDIYED